MTMPTPLCTLCQSLVDNLEPLDNDGQHTYKHHQNYLDLRISAREGCSLCTQFLSAEKTSRTGERIDFHENISASWYGSGVHISTLHESNNRSVFEEARAELYSILIVLRNAFHVSLAGQADNGQDSFTTSVALVPVQATKDNDEPRGCVGSNTRDGLIVAKQWMERCVQSHENCDFNSTGFIPSRLVSTDSENIQLHLAEEFEKPPVYGTSSHCWGNIPFLTLKSSNLNDFRARIPVEAVSRVHQDIIWTAQQLNLPYIWIDSLCILQDDLADWEREASLMEQIYGGSRLNIAATSASDGNSECYSWRPPYWRCRLQTKRGNQEQRFDCVPEQMYREALYSTPLNFRGWVLQERLIAPRTLHLSTKELFWECFGMIACETFPKKFPVCLQDYGPILKKQPIHRSMWKWIVEQYSRCKLTYAKDKLVALSGLARVIHRETGDQYVAGMWRHNLEFQLCWTTDICDVAEQASPYRAPTWSWASHDARIDSDITESFGYVRDGSILWAHILEVKLQHGNQDPFGQLTAAQLIIGSTYLARVIFQADHSKGQCGGMTIGQTVFYDTVWWFDALCYGDATDINIANHFQQICALAIYSFTLNGKSRITGILIEPTGKAQYQYWRVGHFAIEGEEEELIEAFKAAASGCWPDGEDRIHRRINLV